MGTSTRLAGLDLEHPLMNAAGTCKTLEQVEKLARSAVSVITIGSISEQPREGNQGETFWHGSSCALNSPSLPNPGLKYYRRYFPEMVETAHAAGKKLAVSVVGFAPSDFVEPSKWAHWAKADFIELNLGCPNVWEGGKPERIASFDPSTVDEILGLIEPEVMVEGCLGVKLSPFSDPSKMEKIAELLPGRVKYVVACNSFANGLMLKVNGTPVLSSRYGGVSGAALKPIALGQVARLRELLPKRIGVVGVGGIGCGQDMLDFLRVGADAVQVATAYIRRENPMVFSDILEDFVHIMGAESQIETR